MVYYIYRVIYHKKHQLIFRFLLKEELCNLCIAGERKMDRYLGKINTNRIKSRECYEFIACQYHI